MSASELHPFLFEGLPVRGRIVRLTDAWQDILQRRAGNTGTGPYPRPVQRLLGQMAAAAVLLQSSIRFDGALVLQISGDGPVRLAVVEVQSDLGLRATAALNGSVPEDADLAAMVNPGGQGRCAITLDPRQRRADQQPYQGVVSLTRTDGSACADLAEVLGAYMLQSEQLDTTLVLAAGADCAAGLMVQRVPLAGQANLAGRSAQAPEQDSLGANEDYRRIALLTASAKPDELLQLDIETMLHRLYWQEPLARHPVVHPRFACNCSRERVARMLQGLGQSQADEVLAERGLIEVGCEFCGQQYRFDAVDAAQLFTQAGRQAPGSASLQ